MGVRSEAWAPRAGSAREGPGKTLTLFVAQEAQRSASGTSFSAAAMCCPQPFQVGFWQSPHTIFMHMLACVRRVARENGAIRFKASMSPAGGRLAGWFTGMAGTPQRHRVS